MVRSVYLESGFIQRARKSRSLWHLSLRRTWDMSGRLQSRVSSLINTCVNAAKITGLIEKILCKCQHHFLVYIRSQSGFLHLILTRIFYSLVIYPRVNQLLAFSLESFTENKPHKRTECKNLENHVRALPSLDFSSSEFTTSNIQSEKTERTLESRSKAI